MKTIYVIFVILFSVVLSACSSNSSATSTSSNPAKPTTTLSTEISVHEITSDFQILFNLSDPAILPKVQVVEDGSSLESDITSTFHSSLAKTAVGARVDSVQMESSSGCTIADQSYPCALVTYDILGPNNAPIFSTPSTGYAVFKNGKWLVSKNTICGLLALASGGKTPQGC